MLRTFEQILDLINRYAEEHPFSTEPANLYDPCTYTLQLGGKRLRPALAVMSAELFDAPPETALPIAWAIELFHNFSLIHDDIMDAAPLRRGHATVHTKWNLTAGILSGDVMLICAYQHLVSTPNRAAVPALIEAFNRVAVGVCEGQQYDMDFETSEIVTLEAYTRMIELKTAVLLGGALEMGAICANAPAEDVQRLYDFGRLAGIAFQIQDDLLDTYGDPATFGKQVGGDILQNKKTFLVLKTYEVATPADQAALRTLLSSDSMIDSDEKIAAVRRIFDQNNIPALVADEKRRFEELAFASLAAVAIPEERKAILRGMVAQLLHREK